MPNETIAKTLKIGEADSSGRIVTDILGKDRDIIVYLAKCGKKSEEQAFFEFREKEKGSSPEYLPKIIDEFGRIQTLISMTSLSPKHVKMAQAEAGKAFMNAYRSLTKNKEADHSVLFSAANNYLSQSAEQSARFIYVLGGLSTLFVSLLVLGVIYTQIFFAISEEIKVLVLCCAGGAAGATLSILQRGKAIEINPFSTTKYLCFEGGCRVFLGILFSVVLYIGSKSDMILSLAKTNPYALVFLSILSGFNERFVKELMTRSENEMLRDGKDKAQVSQDISNSSQLDSSKEAF